MMVCRVAISVTRLPTILANLPEVPTKERSDVPGARDRSSCLTEATSNSGVVCPYTAQHAETNTQAKAVFRMTKPDLRRESAAGESVSPWPQKRHCRQRAPARGLQPRRS